MDPTEEHPGPFGLTREEIREAFQRTQGRPVGRPRYEAFAHELEQAATRKWVGTEYRSLALAHAYGRLMRRAKVLRCALSQALGFIRAQVPGVDVRPGLAHIVEFDAEFPGGDA